MFKLILFYLFILISHSSAAKTAPEVNWINALTQGEQSFECLKKAPSCQQGVPSEHVLGIFLTIDSETFSSTYNILETFINDKIKAPINVLLTLGLLESKDFLQKIIFLKHLASDNQVKLNFIPHNSSYPLPNYFRDPGVFQFSKGQVTIYALPYLQGDALGIDALDSVAHYCGHELISGFEHKPDDLAHYDQWNELQRTILMGGNISTLPGNILAFGETPQTQFDKKVLKKILNGKKPLPVPIPHLEVGHFDELYHLVPNKNSTCGYTLIMASPLVFKEFLQKRPAQELVISTVNPDLLLSDSASTEDLLFAQRFYLLLNEVNEKAKKEGVVDSKTKNKLSVMAKKKLQMEGNKNLTAADILQNTELMQYFDSLEKDIIKGSKVILDSLHKTLNKKCDQEIIKLPVFFNPEGEQLMANPVNGEIIEGTYYFSRPMRTLYKDEINWNAPQKSLDLGPEWKNYTELEEAINSTISQALQIKVKSIETIEYDMGAGNLHCATNTVRLQCD